MNVYYGLSQFTSKKNTSIAIGIFDGVHRGHQYLIKQTVDYAKKHRLSSVVLTFYPHPAHVMHPGIALSYLTSLQQRLSLLEDLGVDHVVILKFSTSFAQIVPEKFVTDTLLKKLKAKAIFVGEDFRFGRARAGNIYLLRDLGKQYDFKFEAIKALKSGVHVISSTRLRGLITEGNLKQAHKLLGRHFSVMGNVVRGEGRGKRLGFPTANIDYEDSILPPQGVYAVRLIVNGRSYPAVANLGVRPTFKNKKEGIHLEVHVLQQASLNLYGKNVTVEFIDFIREERSFPDKAALISQIMLDVRRAIKILQS